MVLGLLGGVGSGKSLVASLLEEMGAVVVRADEIAHEALEEPHVRDALRSWWGPAVFDPDGRVDRSSVARRVFEDRLALERLEALIHPLVAARIRTAVKEHAASLHTRPAAAPAPARLHPVLVLDVPLLLEASLEPLCDRLLYVEAPLASRLERVQRQRSWDASELARREARQAPLAEKERAAQIRIDNSGSLASTRKQVEDLWRRLQEDISESGVAETGDRPAPPGAPPASMLPED